MWCNLAAKTAAILVLGAMGALAIPTATDAKTPLACGSVYTITRGDTLFKVADRAYADGHLFKRIYLANRDYLPDEASVEIGDQLLVPCLDGTGPQTRRDALAEGLIAEPRQPDVTGTGEANAADEETPLEPADLHDTAGESVGEAAVENAQRDRSLAASMEAASLAVLANLRPGAFGVAASLGQADEAVRTPGDARIRLLAGGDSAPYAGEALPDGGMITELLGRALRAAGAPLGFRVTFVANDRAHVEDLLADGAFDVGFPWYEPDCARPDQLSPEALAACRNFEFSAPLVEAWFGYYARQDDPLARAEDFSSLHGKRLCLPQGQFVSDPQHEALSGLQIAIETAPTARDCFRRLADRAVDAVQMVKPDAWGTVRSMGLEDEIAEIAALHFKRTLHAAVARSNPRGQAQLALINRGLRQLMESGAWFKIVASHQSARLARAY